MRTRVRRLVALAAVAGVSVIPALAATETAHAADWFPLGGPYGSDPSVLQRGNVVFAVGQAGDPFYHEFGGTGHWSGSIPLGGQIDSVIAPAEQLVGSQPTNFEVFGIGVDGAMWYRTRNSGWQGLGGAFLSSPTSAIFGGQTYVFAVGLDQAVWYRTPNTEWASLGGTIVSDLGVTSDGSSMYVTGIGTDNGIWAQRFSGGAWQGWQGLGGDVISYPATTNIGSNGYIFVIGADGAVWYQGVSNGSWSGWYGLGGAAESAPAAIVHGNGQIDVFVVGADLRMYSHRWNGSGWSGWQDQGGGFTSNPVVDDFEVFALGFDDWLYRGAI
jgi:hypothetical protein